MIGFVHYRNSIGGGSEDAGCSSGMGAGAWGRDEDSTEEPPPEVEGEPSPTQVRKIHKLTSKVCMPDLLKKDYVEE